MRQNFDIGVTHLPHRLLRVAHLADKLVDLFLLVNLEGFAAEAPNNPEHLRHGLFNAEDALPDPDTRMSDCFKQEEHSIDRYNSTVEDKKAPERHFRIKLLRGTRWTVNVQRGR